MKILRDCLLTIVAGVILYFATPAIVLMFQRVFPKEVADGTLTLAKGRVHNECWQFASNRSLKVRVEADSELLVAILPSREPVSFYTSLLATCEDRRVDAGACDTELLAQEARLISRQGGFRQNILKDTLRVPVDRNDPICVLYMSAEGRAVEIDRRVTTTPR